MVRVALQLTFSQTAVASRQYQTDRRLLWRRAMERALIIQPKLNFVRLCSERAPVWRLLCAVAADAANLLVSSQLAYFSDCESRLAFVNHRMTVWAHWSKVPNGIEFVLSTFP